ncbi:hypothetical protein H4582DRAFT_2052470 [Lactarius indigo]|nr:hypothetical protein H4582DRAFT_2052470 [Lactarius indigo]
MAELIRNAKSASDWTRNELAAYNITVEYQDAATFFGTHNLPQPATIDPAVLTATDPDDAANDSVYELLRTMDLAMSPVLAEESAVNDFSVLLLRALRYNTRGRCFKDEEGHPSCYLWREQEDKRHMDNSDPEPQLIAKAIAAFAANNQTRRQTPNLTSLDSKMMTGITLKGTVPILTELRSQ